MEKKQLRPTKKALYERTRNISAEWLANEMSQVYIKFFDLDTIDQLVSIKEAVPTRSPLIKLIDRLITDLQKLKVESPDEFDLSGLQFEVESEVDRLIRRNALGLLKLLTVLSYFDTDRAFFSVERQQYRLKKAGLTRKTFHIEVTKLISGLFESIPIQGPVDGPPAPHKALEVLALYNRLSISITNARSDYKALGKLARITSSTKTKSEDQIVEICSRYHIPEEISDIVLGSDFPSDIAKEHLAEISGLSFEGLNKQVKRGRQEWKAISTDVPGLKLVDIVRVGHRVNYYAVDSKDREKCKDITFNLVPKEGNVIDRFEEGFLVLLTI